MKNNNMPVLMYHGISEYQSNFHRTIISSKQFYQQMLLIDSLGYKTVDISEAFAYFEGSKKNIKPIIITFDDGYLSALKIAFPFMQKLGLVGTLFLSAKTVGQEKFENSENLDLDDRPLNWGEVLFLQKNGWSIQSHGFSHENYNLLNINEISKELALSKRIIEERTRQPVDYFAYPFGKYSGPLIQATRQLYKGAFSTHQGLWMPLNPKYQIPRIEINNNTNQQIFLQKLKIGYPSQKKLLIGHIKNKIFKNVKLYDRLRGL